MVRGRKPGSQAAKELAGTTAKHPESNNPLEPAPEMGEPEIPQTIKDNPEALREWKRTVRIMRQQKILTTADGWLIAQLATMRSLLVKLTPTMLTGRANTSVINQFKFAFTEERKIVIELGLTPIQRSRLRIVTPEAPTMFEEFMKRRLKANDN